MPDLTPEDYIQILSVLQTQLEYYEVNNYNSEDLVKLKAKVKAICEKQIAKSYRGE